MANGAATHAPVYAGNLHIDANVVHQGDSNTYFGFHSNDQYVVTAGVERIEVSGVSTNALVNLRANTEVTGSIMLIIQERIVAKSITISAWFRN